MMIGGIGILGFAVSLFRLSSFGTDPFTTLNLGVSGFVGMSFGAYQLIVNAVLFVLVWIYARQCIGAGTIVNMVFVGFISDLFMQFYSSTIDGTLSFYTRIGIMVIAVLIACIAVSLYMTADLGIAPYDALAIMIQKVTNNKIPFPVARVITDVTSVLIGFSFGAVVGVSTVIMAFFTGPLVQFFNTVITKSLSQAANKKLTEKELVA